MVSYRLSLWSLNYNVSDNMQLHWEFILHTFITLVLHLIWDHKIGQQNNCWRISFTYSSLLLSERILHGKHESKRKKNNVKIFLWMLQKKDTFLIQFYKHLFLREVT